MVNEDKARTGKCNNNASWSTEGKRLRARQLLPSPDPMHFRFPVEDGHNLLLSWPVSGLSLKGLDLSPLVVRNQETTGRSAITLLDTSQIATLYYKHSIKFLRWLIYLVKRKTRRKWKHQLKPVRVLTETVCPARTKSIKSPKIGNCAKKKHPGMFFSRKRNYFCVNRGLAAMLFNGPMRRSDPRGIFWLWCGV